MNLFWWLLVISIFFYPFFVFAIVFTEKYPNNKFSKWWEKHIVEKNEDYD